MEYDRVNQISNFNDNRCRACTCIADEKTMISLLDGRNSELFSICTSLEVEICCNLNIKSHNCFPKQIIQSDELPDHICSKCYIELENVDQFRQKCLMSDLQLRNQVTNSE